MKTLKMFHNVWVFSFLFWLSVYYRNSDSGTEYVNLMYKLFHHSTTFCFSFVSSLSQLMLMFVNISTVHILMNKNMFTLSIMIALMGFLKLKNYFLKLQYTQRNIFNIPGDLDIFICSTTCKHK